MKNRHYNTNNGMSVLGLVVLIALVPLISWGLNFMIERDFAEPSLTKGSSTKSEPLENEQLAAASVLSTSTVATTSPNTAATPATSGATTSSQAAAVTKTVASTPAKTPDSAPVSDQTVTLTDKGFSPATITVSRGQSVTFVNNSTSKMWVASNPFPSSSEYPDFNQKEGVGNGESWTFTFDQAGTWFYHNHFSPATGAKIIVKWK